MTTVLHNPSAPTTEGSAGFLIGVTLTLILAFLFILYGLPVLRNSYGNVPSNVDVSSNKHK